MEVVTSQYEAMTQELLRARVRITRQDELIIQEQQQRKQMAHASRRHDWEMMQRIQALQAQIQPTDGRRPPRTVPRSWCTVEAPQGEPEPGNSEFWRDQALFWAKMAWQFSSWWAKGLALREQMREEYTRYKEWTQRLFGNQSLDPGAKVYEWGLHQAIDAGHIRDQQGRTLVDAGEIERITGIPRRTQERYRETLKAAGVIDTSYVFDPIAAKGHTYIKWLEAAQHPEQQQKAADAPQRGGYRRKFCPECGTEMMEDQKIITILTCPGCHHQEEEEGVPKLVHYPEQPPAPVHDVWEEERASTEQSYVKPPMPGEPVLWRVPSKAPPQRRAAQPCPVCGGTEERERLGYWVCVGCYPNPFQKKGA